MTEHKYTREQMLDKIGKLLALASDPAANEHIAAQSTAKAQELMQAWAIEEADLERKSTGAEVKFKVGQSPALRRKLEWWECNLALDLAKAFMVKAVRINGDTARAFAGRETDVDVALYTYEQLVRTLDEMAKRAFAAEAARIKSSYGKSVYNVAQCRAYSNCHPTVFRSRWTQSWLLGAATTVGAALIAQTQKFTSSSSQALVVVDTKAAAAEAFTNDYFGKLTNRTRKSMLIYTEAQQKGAEAGKSVQVRKGLGAEPGQRQLS